MSDTKPCKCENDFMDFEMLLGGSDDDTLVTIDRDYKGTVEYANRMGRYFLRLYISGYTGSSM